MRVGGTWLRSETLPAWFLLALGKRPPLTPRVRHKNPLGRVAFSIGIPLDKHPSLNDTVKTSYLTEIHGGADPIELRYSYRWPLNALTGSAPVAYRFYSTAPLGPTKLLRP